MYIALTTVSQDPSVLPALVAVAQAIEVQLYQHYAPFWQSSGMAVKLYPSPDEVPNDDAVTPLVVFDDPDQAGFLGWHACSPSGQGYGRAFWGVIKRAGGTLIDGPNSLSVTLSHEALEMVGNPYANFWSDVDDDTQEAVELCDRVEADSYIIATSGGNVSVSNFVGPRAFRHGPGPYDWMRLLTEPFQIRPGGYAIRRQGKNVQNVWGMAYPEEKKALKALDSSRASKRALALTRL